MVLDEVLGDGVMVCVWVFVWVFEVVCVWCEVGDEDVCEVC